MDIHHDGADGHDRTGHSGPEGEQRDLGCRFDPDTTRAWLTSPHPDSPHTVAQNLGIVDDFDIYGFERWLRISNLIAAAQTAGVFGPDGASVGVLHLAGERGFVNAHRFTLTTPGQPTLCSGQIDTVDLLTDHLAGIDAAVHLLDRAASVADTLLRQQTELTRVDPATPTTQHDQTPTPTAVAPPPRAARAFRPLAIDPHPAAARPATAPDAAASSRRHR